MFGWYLSAIMLLTVLVNTLISLWDTLIELISLIKKYGKKLLIKIGCLKTMNSKDTVSIKPIRTLLDEDFDNSEQSFNSANP
jgi:hypothetical protein